jgi:hypothetical protein
LGGSQFGLQLAAARYTTITLNGTTVSTNGPTAGAFSYANTGVGSARGVSWGSFNNSLAADQTFKVNAILDGEFHNDQSGLDGTLRGGAAVHVFDTDKFNAAFSANVGQFLLGGYTPTDALDPSLVFNNTDLILGAAEIGPGASFDFGNTCFPACLPPPLFDQPFTRTLATPLFTVKAGKSFTVMFDVVASGMTQERGTTVLGTPILGTGEVDFISTLKPAANIFTDANDNPIMGITAVGAQPVIPPSATNLTLAPPTGTDLVGAAHTLTAAATGAGATPISDTIVKFNIVSGPNAGLVGGGITDANGQAVFSYIGKGGAGMDSIQARIGTLQSNVVQETWVADATPPVIVPQISGTLGNNGWYKSNVTVGWNVSDPESGIASSSGCGAATLTTDTAGVTLTCSAINGAGLSNSVSVTIKIDKTPPVISGMPGAGCSVSTNDDGDHGNLVKIATVSAADALSGLAPGSLKVTGVSNRPPKDQDKPQIVITPNGSGGFVVRVRAADDSEDRPRVFTLTATVSDLAGNTATVTGACTARNGDN